MIEPGDIVRHTGTGKTYEVVSLVDYAGLPHAMVRGVVTIQSQTYHVPMTPDAHALPVPIAHLELISKGGIEVDRDSNPRSRHRDHRRAALVLRTAHARRKSLGGFNMDTPDWIVHTVFDRGQGHCFRYQVTGENLSAHGDDREFCWSIQEASLSNPRYDLSSAVWVNEVQYAK